MDQAKRIDDVVVLLELFARLPLADWPEIVIAARAIHADPVLRAEYEAAGHALDAARAGFTDEAEVTTLAEEIVALARLWLGRAYPGASPEEIESHVLYVGPHLLGAAMVVLVADLVTDQIVAVHWRPFAGLVPRLRLPTMPGVALEWVDGDGGDRPRASTAPPRLMGQWADDRYAVGSSNRALRSDARRALVATAVIGSLVPALVVLGVAALLGHVVAGAVFAGALFVVLTVTYIRRRLSEGY